MIPKRPVGRECNIRKNFPEKEVGTRLAIQEQRVFAAPAETGGMLPGSQVGIFKLASGLAASLGFTMDPEISKHILEYQGIRNLGKSQP